MKSGIDVWSEIGDAEEASKVKARTEVPGEGEEGQR